MCKGCVTHKSKCVWKDVYVWKDVCESEYMYRELCVCGYVCWVNVEFTYVLARNRIRKGRVSIKLGKKLNKFW